MKGYYVLGILILIWISACAHPSGSRLHDQKKKPLRELYQSSMREAKDDVRSFVNQKMSERHAFGYMQPYEPIVHMPIVKRVWVVEHESHDRSDVLVGGHWVYVMVKDASWDIKDDPDAIEQPLIPKEAKSNQHKERKDEYENK